MYKNNLLKTIQTAEFIADNALDINTLDLLDDTVLNVLSNNRNDNMKRIIEQGNFFKLIDSPDLLNKLLNDTTGKFTSLITSNSDIRDIEVITNTTPGIINIISNAIILHRSEEQKKLLIKDIILFCSKSNITSTDIIYSLSKFINKHCYAFYHSNLNEDESKKNALNFVCKHNCYTLHLPIVEHLVEVNIESSSYFKQILDFLIYFEDNHIYINAFRLFPDSTRENDEIALEKFNLYKEILEIYENSILTKQPIIVKTNRCRFSQNNEIAHIIQNLINEDFSIKEIKTLIYKFKEGATLYTDARDVNTLRSLLKIIYPNYIDFDYEEHVTSDWDKFKFEHYLLSHKKGKFIKTISNMDSYKIKPNFIISGLYKKINLNNLNEIQIRKIDFMGHYFISQRVELGESNSLEFYQLEELSKFSVRQAEAFNSIPSGSLDSKIGIAKLFTPDLDMKYLSLNYGLSMDDLIKLLIAERLEDRISKIVDTRVIPFNSINITLWIELILSFGEYDYFKSQIKDSTDIQFLIDYSRDGLELNKDMNLASEKRKYFKDSAFYLWFVNSLGLSDELREQYEEEIYQFYCKGLIEVYQLYQDDIFDDAINDNFKKITKAAILGKLDELKFYPGDLALELDFDIDKELEERWKNNINLNINGFNVLEDYSYETCMQIGENPTTTCLSYIDGPYKECLLSSFDANKKLLIIKTPDGRIASRAFLRLTKITKSKPNTTSNDLGFKDVTEIDISAPNSETPEEVVLFLEKTYTYLNNHQDAEEATMKAAYEKAKEMGVRLVISGYYDEYTILLNFDDDASPILSEYIYIAKSKNSTQYLDSFHGELRTGEETYMSANGCISVFPLNFN